MMSRLPDLPGVSRLAVDRGAQRVKPEPKVILEPDREGVTSVASRVAGEPWLRGGGGVGGG